MLAARAHPAHVRIVLFVHTMVNVDLGLGFPPAVGPCIGISGPKTRLRSWHFVCCVLLVLA
jgi:hypothetical protein